MIGSRAALTLVLAATAVAAAQDMPDPSLIHGRAIPAPELSTGTITVRVVREAIGNNLSGQQVTLTIGNDRRTAVTDELGRAEFPGLASGGVGRAETTVDGEALLSEPFSVPASGGLRVILIAGIAEAAERQKQEASKALAAPPVKGTVALGGDTRIVAEFQSDALRLFYRLDILNNARSRVDIGGPLIIDLPRGAAGAALLPDAPKSATVSGERLIVTGPFDPGTTTVEVGFELRYSGTEHTLVQRWPVAVQQWLVGVERVSGLVVTSPQLQNTEERSTGDGSVFLVGTGPAFPAGSELAIQLSNLPAHSRVASTVALALALGLLALGAWFAFARRNGEADSAQVLVRRRATLLAKLEELERSRNAGTVSGDKYVTRRERLIRDLEQIYSELDEAGDPPASLAS